MVRHLFTLLLAAALLLAPAPSLLAQASFPANATVATATELRTGPGLEYAVAGAAQPGQPVVLLAANAKGTWFRLGKGLWIDATAVTVQGAATAGAARGAVPLGARPAILEAVVDGDTISVLVDGVVERVRYIGIDTPERGQPGYKAAATANRQLVTGATLYLVQEESDRDRYGRLLRNVYLASGLLVNGELVAQGFAQPVAYPPDTAHHEELVRLAVAAAHARQGFWSGTAPYDGAMPYALTTAAATLYAAPGDDAAVTATLAAATPLTLFGRTRDNRWFQVRTPTRAGGWVAAGTVKVYVPLAQVPVGK